MADGVAADVARLVIDEIRREGLVIDDIRREDGPMPLCVHLGTTNEYDHGAVAIVKPTLVNENITYQVGYQDGHSHKDTYFVQMTLDAILRIAVVQAKSIGRDGVGVCLYKHDNSSGDNGRLTGVYVYFTPSDTSTGSSDATEDSCLETMTLFVRACVH